MTNRLLAAGSLALLVASVPLPARAWWCGVNDAIWLAGHQTAEHALEARVTLLGTDLSAQRAVTLEMLLSAAKVNTAQEATNGGRESTMVKSSQQAVASTLSEQARRDAIVDAHEQYSFESGQGVNTCDAINLTATVTQALSNIGETGRKLYTGIDVSPGKATTVAAAAATRLTSSALTDAEPMFDASASDDARKALIQHLAGLPLPLPDASMPQVSADLMLMRARRVEALRSPALVSLNAVRAMSAADAHETGTSDVSPFVALDQLIAQYGGGDGFETWSAGLAAQSEHGLLVELARLRAVSLTLRQTQTEQQARLAALFATMVAVQAGGEL
jgi:hypothetical protein